MPEPDKLTKAESARINGSKSQGAVTEQGKRNSANGNLRHGAYAKRVLLDGEDPTFYETFKLTFFEHFQPVGPFEFECLESMVTARWRIRRIESAETCLINTALAASKPQIEHTFEQIDIVHERALAVESKLATLESLTRIQDKLHRIYDRNYKLLVKSRSKSGRPIPDSQPLPKTQTSEPRESAPEPMNQPNTETPPAPVASILTQTLIVIAILALLLLSPTKIRGANLPSSPVPAVICKIPVTSSPLSSILSCKWRHNLTTIS